MIRVEKEFEFKAADAGDLVVIVGWQVPQMVIDNFQRAYDPLVTVMLPGVEKILGEMPTVKGDLRAVAKRFFYEVTNRVPGQDCKVTVWAAADPALRYTLS